MTLVPVQVAINNVVIALSILGHAELYYYNILSHVHPLCVAGRDNGQGCYIDARADKPAGATTALCRDKGLYYRADLLSLQYSTCSTKDCTVHCIFTL